MPPKVRNYITATPITVANSDQKIAATSEGAADDTGSGMRPEDVLFLIDCLQNTMGGQVQVSQIATPLYKHRDCHHKHSVDIEHLPHIP